MSTEFQREERYLVFKLSDVAEHFTPGERLQLARLAEVQRVGRSESGKPLLECVVVEADWPEYEPTWNAIEARMTGAQPSPNALLAAVANLVAQMEIVSRVGFVDTPNDKDSCAAFCVAEGSWLELMSAVESLASALAAAGKAAKRHGAQPAQSVPDGWKLVPIEPTYEMLEAGEDTLVPTYTDTPVSVPFDVYRAMLASAPEAKP